MPEAQQAEPQSAPQPQVTTGTKPHNWKKVGLTVLIIIVVAGLIIVAYWFLVLNKSSDDSDLTGPVPKVTTKTSTESAKEATESVEKNEIADWKTFNGSAGAIDLQKDEPSVKFSVKYPPNLATKDKVHNYALVHSEPYRLGLLEPGEISVSFGAYSQAGKDIVPDVYSNPKSTTPTTLGGREARKYVTTYLGTQTLAVVYFVENSGQNNMAFELKCVFVPKDGVDLEKTCNQIADSLKFIN